MASLRSAANCGGTIQTSLTYDARGNIATKDGMTFDFDLTNRLKSIDNGGVVENYRYDGYGLRALKNAASGNLWSQYTHDGRLLQEVNARTGIQTEYVYLGGSLVAERETPTTGGASVVKYQHTDALGTPVAVTSASRTVLTRNEYEPYGQLLNHTITDAVGYTGHVQDAMTGLTYMQQRYYDPMIGRFLSVDPVTATSVGGNFNRYWYANDNPYSFTDPDGRKADEKYDPSKWKGRDWSQLSAHSSNGVTASARQISTNDIAVVQDRNAVTGKTTPVQSDSNVPTQSELQGIVDSINKAGDVLVEKSATEEVQNFNKMKIFLTLTDHGNDFAYATPMPNGDLVMTINYRRAMGKLNFNERVGKFLHEIRHFSARNIQLHDAWYARLREDPTIQDSVTNSYHEADAYQFQEKMGYPNNANH